MKSGTTDPLIVSEPAENVDIPLSPSIQSSSDFQSASDPSEEADNQEKVSDTTAQFASWDLSSPVEATSSSLPVSTDPLKPEPSVPVSFSSSDIGTNIDAECPVTLERNLSAQFASASLGEPLPDDSEAVANEGQSLIYYLENTKEEAHSTFCEVNEQQLLDHVSTNSEDEIPNEIETPIQSEAIATIPENIKESQSQYSSMIPGPCSGQLCIPIVLLTMSPTPDMLESYGHFHEIAHNLISVCDVAPHLSLVGDIRLLRFLIGYRMNEILASDAFRKHLQWLKLMSGDTLIRKYIEAEMLDQLRPENAPNHEKVLRHFPINFLLRDESGNPILDKEGNILSIERPGFLDEKRLSAELSDSEIMLWHTYQLEFRSMLLDRMSQDRNMIVKATIIIDLAGFTTRSVNRQTMNLLRQSIFLASENYPETMSYVFFVNTPKVFFTVWNVLKGWLNERTLSKIHILDCSYEEVLFRYIDKVNLPKFLGGSALSPLATVPLCGLLSNDRFGLGINRQTLTITPRKKEQLFYKLFGGMQLSWAWALRDQDVGFSVKLVRAISNQSTIRKANEETIVEFQRYDSSRTIRGLISASSNSTIIFTWDNSWGLFSSRVIHYEIVQLIEADQRLSLDV
ncbi:CRAL/TRIO domain-containing protein [Cardiosporidium cionae]|uniref:CRAL/TRIO domain-containing protein n=1 Tax=Cardiosporidium cionae TaxID=476202 RepID=A0ABQ7JBQ3_9APIC|nr:CRAL/TRIO domain-containing protein [Cardiosporidium cionae]|eukprot:KAF8821396.1 CRAL/TRIO domain-containing protein [Cardiosporidium cionae]